MNDPVAIPDCLDGYCASECPRGVQTEIGFTQATSGTNSTSQRVAFRTSGHILIIKTEPSTTAASATDAYLKSSTRKITVPNDTLLVAVDFLQ